MKMTDLTIQYKHASKYATKNWPFRLLFMPRHWGILWREIKDEDDT